MMQPCDRRPGVTPSAPGCECDVQLRVTVTGLIDYTFTLLFRHGAIAVLQVHGAPNQDEARAFASSVLPNSYEVVDGDETHGHGETFHAWTCVAAQQALSLQKAREREEMRRHLLGKVQCALKLIAQGEAGDEMYNLNRVEQVRLAENVSAWIVRGETGDGFASSLAEFRHDQEDKAHAQAIAWCKRLGFPRYQVFRFTEEAYIYLLCTIAVESGEILEVHTEDYNKTGVERRRKEP